VEKENAHGERKNGEDVQFTVQVGEVRQPEDGEDAGDEDEQGSDETHAQVLRRRRGAVFDPAQEVTTFSQPMNRSLAVP
jgi:hypothetical protein